MLERSMFLSLNFYKKEPLQGSYKGLRYQFTMITQNEEKLLNVTLWPEPYCIDATPEEKKRINNFSFDEEGYQKAIDWMNEMYSTIKDMVSDALLTEPYEKED